MAFLHFSIDHGKPSSHDIDHGYPSWGMTWNDSHNVVTTVHIAFSSTMTHQVYLVPVIRWDPLTISYLETNQWQSSCNFMFPKVTRRGNISVLQYLMGNNKEPGWAINRSECGAINKNPPRKYRFIILYFGRKVRCYVNHKDRLEL